mgnify:CR=1 FL=1
MQNRIAIKTENLSKTYRSGKTKRVEALKDLNLEVQEGEVFGFLGPNGAGKSTTIKLLMGLIFPTSGSFTIKGIDGRDRNCRRFVGYLPENPSFYDYLTAEELLAFVGRNFGMSEGAISSETERLLKLLDLYDARQRPIRSYSKGMVQRLGLAQALIHDPDILILDEPMSGLDPLGRILVKDLILDLKKQGKTIFMSTHILNDLEVLCDRVGIIVKGELRAVVDISELMIKGIGGYTLFFRGLSEKTKEVLKAFGAKEIDNLKYEIEKDKFPDLMASLKEVSSEVSLVEPLRKGLEELFREIVYEG